METATWKVLDLRANEGIENEREKTLGWRKKSSMNLEGGCPVGSLRTSMEGLNT